MCFDIYIAQIKSVQSINLEKGEGSEKLLWVHGQTFQEFGPHQYLITMRLSSLWRKKLEISIKMDRGFHDDDSDWKRRGMGTTIFL